MVLGAGRSASTLIRFLLEYGRDHNMEITVADADIDTATQKVAGFENGRAIAVHDLTNHALDKLIREQDLVISLLPASLHPQVARACLRNHKHLVTASYVSPEMQALHDEAALAGLTFLNEMGLDPGIDHMSAMETLHRIHAEGGKMISFKSYCGGLIAPESNDNPWGYKFTWNPRNVVLAGKAGAVFRQQGNMQRLDYHALFRHVEHIHVHGYGDFDAYANRDSMAYEIPYRLEGIPTLLRGTLRYHPFCKAWDVLVQLGLTDESPINSKDWNTIADWVLSHTGGIDVQSELEKVCKYDARIIEMMVWLGLTETAPVPAGCASDADILQHLMESRMVLNPEDKDMIVMQHIFEYRIGNQVREVTSSLVVTGKDTTHTAMSMTVGLPAAMGAVLILEGRVQAKGVCIPVTPEWYEPVLKWLGEFGIQFTETRRNLQLGHI